MSSRSQRLLVRSARNAAALTFTSLFAGASLFAQGASIGGTVIIDPGEKPLANAEILISNLNRSARSDSAGNFVLSGLNPGKYSVIVRLPGYESFNADVTLASGQKFEADYLMRPSSTRLAAVDVKAKSKVDNGMWMIKLAEFEERRAVGIGKFLTADVFEQADGRPASSVLLEHIAGLKVVQSNGRRWLASARGGKGFGAKAMTLPGITEDIPYACYMQIIVNGIARYNGSAGQPMFDIDALNTRDIIGFEFFTTATTPLQYNTTRNQGSCGTVVIWTKGG